LTPEQIHAAQELASGYINIASACEADTNTLFNSFSMAVSASLISYMENSGIPVTEENMWIQIQKFKDQTDSVSNFYVCQYLNIKEKK
jgi:hypothetical protein